MLGSELFRKWDVMAFLRPCWYPSSPVRPGRRGPTVRPGHVPGHSLRLAVLPGDYLYSGCLVNTPLSVLQYLAL